MVSKIEQGEGPILKILRSSGSLDRLLGRCSSPQPVAMEEVAVKRINEVGMRRRRSLWTHLLVFSLVAGGLTAGLADRAGALSPRKGVVAAPVQLAQAAPGLDRLKREGRLLFMRECAPCHGDKGQGGAGPKLVGHAFLSNAGQVAGQILGGGVQMPPFKASLKDRQIAAIGTYVRNAWGNDYGIVTVDLVGRIRPLITDE